MAIHEAYNTISPGEVVFGAADLLREIPFGDSIVALGDLDYAWDPDFKIEGPRYYKVRWHENADGNFLSSPYKWLRDNDPESTAHESESEDAL